MCSWNFVFKNTWEDSMDLYNTLASQQILSDNLPTLVFFQSLLLLEVF